MRIDFLLKRWSSVSAAVAVLLGSGRSNAAKTELFTDETAKKGDDQFEPLILQPPAAKTISEQQFAGHVSHSSHASHASHASHYSGSYSQPYSTATPNTSPTAPAPTPIVTRIELADGKVIYGTVYVKSAAGITFKGPDGNLNKLERQQLSARTIAELGLPQEQTPIPATSPSSSAEDINALRQKNDELDKSVKALQSENETLKEQFRALNAKLGSSPAPARVDSAGETSSTKFRVSGVPDSNTLNVRAGPGSNFPVVTSLWAKEHGITLLPGRINNRNTTWQQISVNGYEGWVNNDFLAREKP